MSCTYHSDCDLDQYCQKYLNLDRYFGSCESRKSLYYSCNESRECRQNLKCVNGSCRDYYTFSNNTPVNLSGIIIGCSVGGIFLFILIVILIVAKRKRSRRLEAKRTTTTTAVAPQPPLPSSYTTPTMYYQHEQHTAQPASSTYFSPSVSPSHHSPTSITTPNIPSAPPMNEPPPPYKR